MGGEKVGELTKQNLQEIGDRIRTHRENRKWSQEELADKIGVSKNTIYSIEKGLQYFTIDKLACFSIVFEVTMDSIVNGGESKQSIEEELLQEIMSLMLVEQKKLLGHIKLEKQFVA